MCGHVGVFGSGLSRVHGDIFEDMLLLDMIRGIDGTGVTVVDAANKVSVFKKAEPAFDFLRGDVSLTIVAASTKKALLGHNRYATVGGLSDASSHPFQHGHITMAHNGTLRSRAGLLGTASDFEVDSEQIAYTLSKKESPIEAVQGMNGAYALVWHDSTDNTIHFMRNHERPMFIIKEKDKDVYFYGSELGILLAAINRKKRSIVLEEPFELPVLTHRTYKLGTTFSEDTEVLEDETYKSTYVYSYPSYSGYSGKGGYQSRYDNSVEDELDELSEFYKGVEQEADEDWLLGIDSTDNKNLVWVKPNIEIPITSGLARGSAVEIHSLEWHPYVKDNPDGFGVLCGFIFETGNDFIVHSVTKTIGEWYVAIQNNEPSSDEYELWANVVSGAGEVKLNGLMLGDANLPCIVLGRLRLMLKGNVVRPKLEPKDGNVIPFEGGKDSKKKGKGIVKNALAKLVEVGSGIYSSCISEERFKVLQDQGCAVCDAHLTYTSPSRMVLEQNRLCCETCIVAH